MIFDKAFAILIGEEGGFSAVPTDPGNWTGGAVGRGRLGGTKYGVSAAAFPALDIPNLTLATAQNIYRTEYWDKICGDSLPVELAMLAFDTAVNSGAGTAATLLQEAVGVDADGWIGPETLAAVKAHTDVAALCAELLARRCVLMAALPTWRTFGLGWARRLFALPGLAASLSLSQLGT